MVTEKNNFITEKNNFITEKNNFPSMLTTQLLYLQYIKYHNVHKSNVWKRLNALDERILSVTQSMIDIT